jgi:hypothetical protein
MGRGGYLGGSTIVGPRSGWFSKPKPKKTAAKKKHVAMQKKILTNDEINENKQKRIQRKEEIIRMLRERSIDKKAEEKKRKLNFRNSLKVKTIPDFDQIIKLFRPKI